MTTMKSITAKVEDLIKYGKANTPSPSRRNYNIQENLLGDMFNFIFFPKVFLPRLVNKCSKHVMRREVSGLICGNKRLCIPYAKG